MQCPLCEATEAVAGRRGWLVPTEYRMVFLLEIPIPINYADGQLLVHCQSIPGGTHTLEFSFREQKYLDINSLLRESVWLSHVSY